MGRMHAFEVAGRTERAWEVPAEVHTAIGAMKLPQQAHGAWRLQSGACGWAPLLRRVERRDGSAQVSDSELL